MIYQDFDLLIDRSGDRLLAQVVNGPAGQALAEFRVPFSDEQVENYLSSLGRNAGGEPQEILTAKAFGASLFDAVFSREIRACFRRSLEEVRRQSSGLRIRLRIGDPALGNLPWEFLYDRSLGRFIALSLQTPLVRYMDLSERLQPLLLKAPLRVLVMISSPRDFPALDADVEWTRLNDALKDLAVAGRLAIERLEAGSLESLQHRLQSGTHHVFHFIGHGEFDPPSQDGVLIFEAENRRSHKVRAQHLARLLHDHAPLRVALLNATGAAKTSRPFSATAPVLVRHEVAAVIAMQLPMADAAASLFVHEFYTRLANGSPIDVAITAARKSIFAAGDEVEWGTPALYSRVPDGRIFDIDTSSLPRRWPGGEASAPAVYSTPDTKGRIALDIVAAARGEFARGRRVHAIQMLRRYDLGRPSVAAALHELTLEHERLVAQERFGNSGAVQEHLRAAEALLSSGQPSAAWARACDALQLDPSDRDAAALEARLRKMLEDREREQFAGVDVAAVAAPLVQAPVDEIAGPAPDRPSGAQLPHPRANDRAAVPTTHSDRVRTAPAESLAVKSPSRAGLWGVIAVLAAALVVLAARAC
jgi:hypothetical protein